MESCREFCEGLISDIIATGAPFKNICIVDGGQYWQAVVIGVFSLLIEVLADGG